VNRGEIWWASLPYAAGSSPGYRRPVLVVQSDAFNLSKIHTIIVLAISTNLRLANAPGNVLLSIKQSSLPRDSVINVSQIITVDKRFLNDYISTLSARTMLLVEEGMRLVLSL
jgi:mRNA interferase MazF